MRDGNQKTIELVQALYRSLCERRLTLSAAESCTGGLISHYITSVPGVSTCFAGGIIAYSENVKVRLLGISSSELATYGVVSRETVLAMAENIREHAGTDLSIATTGNLGPDVLEDRDKGLVFIAAGSRDDTRVNQLNLKGSRDENKHEAAAAALQLLLDVLEGK